MRPVLACGRSRLSGARRPSVCVESGRRTAVASFGPSDADADAFWDRYRRDPGRVEAALLGTATTGVAMLECLRARFGDPAPVPRLVDVEGSVHFRLIAAAHAVEGGAGDVLEGVVGDLNRWGLGRVVWERVRDASSSSPSSTEDGVVLDVPLSVPTEGPLAAEWDI